MRVMVIAKATPASEAGLSPTEELFAEMNVYNEELVRAGVLLSAEGLVPSKEGARVRFSGDRRTVIDGPFTESKELIAGYWIWQVDSMDEAIEWALKCPGFEPDEPGLEIRRIAEMEDFGENMTPDLQAQEQSLLERLVTNTNA